MTEPDDTAASNHRPRPPGAKLVQMTWSHLLFLHWPVRVDLLRQFVPGALDVDTFDGRAYVGLLSFRVSGLRPAGTPAVPGLSSFLQLNARTYVKHDGMPGAFFFSLDASNPIAVWVARSFLHLPYFRAKMSTTTEGDRLKFTSSRTHQGARSATFDCQWIPGKPMARVREGSLSDFLTERYHLFTVHRDRVYDSNIWHNPWALRQARVVDLDTNIFEAVGLGAPQGNPLAYHCDEVAMEAWPQRESDQDRASSPWMDPALSTPPVT